MDWHRLCAKLLLFSSGKCVGKEIAKFLCFQRGAAECSCQHFSMPAVWHELQKLQMRQKQHSPLYLRSRLEQSTLLAAMIAVLAIKFHILGFKSSWYSQYMSGLSGGGGSDH